MKPEGALTFADNETLDAVRPAVREMLLASPAFKKLSPEDQKQIAQATVKVASYMANPDGVLTEPNQTVVAKAQAEDPVEATKGRLSQSPRQVGEDFRAGAVREGTEQFGELVQKVDFANFVGGLIKNVFQAIVDSSLQQMKAYGELVANVAKTVDDFARDNISENNARDWLAEKYPESFEVNTNSFSDSFAEGGETTPTQTATLSATGENPEEDLKKISQELNLAKPVTDISDPAEETRLVLGARLQMARGRQQLLASMVMLGINRIVVTDGLIHAKVIFDMRASDIAQRRASASMLDNKRETTSQSFRAGYGGWFSPVKAGYSSNRSTDHVTTVQSSVDDASESKAEVKAKLTGEVRVNFKSDYFPMDKMASPQMIASIQGNAQPPEKAITGT